MFRRQANMAVMDGVESLGQQSIKLHPRLNEPWSVRFILVHMIEEYARHCGHADFIRQAIDGQTGDWN